MPNTEQAISQIEQQISTLMRELDRLRRGSNSIRGTIYDAFIDEGNDEGAAEFWSDRIAIIVSNWVSSQRSELGKRIISTGEMPPYTDCLNDLLVSISDSGFPADTPFDNVPVAPAMAAPPPPVPIRDGLSADAQAGPPKMQRVNVPKAKPGAVPLPLPPLETAQ